MLAIKKIGKFALDLPEMMQSKTVKHVGRSREEFIKCSHKMFDRKNSALIQPKTSLRGGDGVTSPGGTDRAEDRMVAR